MDARLGSVVRPAPAAGATHDQRMASSAVAKEPPEAIATWLGDTAMPAAVAPAEEDGVSGATSPATTATARVTCGERAVSSASEAVGEASAVARAWSTCSREPGSEAGQGGLSKGDVRSSLVAGAHARSGSVGPVGGLGPEGLAPMLAGGPELMGDPLGDLRASHGDPRGSLFDEGLTGAELSHLAGALVVVPGG